MTNYTLAVPTFNRLEKLTQLLLTIPERVHVHVSDNGASLGMAFSRQFPNVRVKSVVPAVKIFRNWNLAADSIQTLWMAIPADDDVYYSDSFDIIEKYLIKYAEMDMIVFGHNNIDSENLTIDSWIPRLENFTAPSGFLNFKYGVDARMPSIFIKTELFQKLGGFDEGFNITAADSDFVQRAALIGNVQFVPEVVSGYRIWDGGLTHLKIATTEWMDEIDRWCYGVTEFCKKQNIAIYSKNIHDEIYARNLLSGLTCIKKSSGYFATWIFFSQLRYPFRALIRTHLRLIYRLIKI